MPKMIANLRELILSCAKTELLDKGYNALNIRAIAARCDIAVGTMYNYFPSKEMLAAHIMMADWTAKLERMRAECAEAKSLEQALTALYDGITAFIAVYSLVWADYTFSRGAKSEYASRHNMLVLQLADCLKPVLGRLPDVDAEVFDVFLAENVLVCAGASELKFDTFKRIVSRILK